MEYILGILGILSISTAIVGFYFCRSIDGKDMDNDNDEEENEHNEGIGLHGDLLDICSDLGNALEDYLIDRCISRAKYFGRHTADMADFNSVIFELGLDNPVISELLSQIKEKNI